MALGACTGDLDLMPTDPQKVTAGSFDEDPVGYMDRVMADCYLQFATYGANGNAAVSGTDGGMTTFQRAIFILETIPTDEANWLPAGDADYGLMLPVPTSSRLSTTDISTSLPTHSGRPTNISVRPESSVLPLIII